MLVFLLPETWVGRTFFCPGLRFLRPPFKLQLVCCQIQRQEFCNLGIFCACGLNKTWLSCRKVMMFNHYSPLKGENHRAYWLSNVSFGPQDFQFCFGQFSVFLNKRIWYWNEWKLRLIQGKRTNLSAIWGVENEMGTQCDTGRSIGAS